MDFKIEKIDDGSGDYKGYDLVLEGGDFAMVSGVAETGQKILNRLKVNFQEWYLWNGGVNWTQDVFKQPEGSVVAQDAISRVILQTSGVISIEEFTFLNNDAETRASDVIIKVKVSTGEVITVEVPL